MNNRRGTETADKRNHQMDADARWHLDKRVPIALLMAILIQSCGGFWWAATVSERINNLEKQATISAPQGERLARVEAKLESVQDGITEIKRLVQAKRP